MIAAAQRIRLIAPPQREEHPRVALLVAACAAVDAVAAGMLMLGTPLPLWLEGLAAAACHGTAVLLFSCFAQTRPSRRWLCVAAVLAVPCVGAAIAAAAFVTRGRGTVTVGRRRKPRRRSALSMAAMRRLRDALSPCDALYSGNDEQRLAALSTLSRRGDREAIALLRRAAADRDPDLALAAALVLDEIGERAERQVERLEPREARRAAG